MISKGQLSKTEYTKLKTIELYDSLPDDEEGRKARLDVRDEVIELNYNFFGYVASHTFINNPSVTYEDKLQSALCGFCTCWWWYKWAERYRTDLAFTVFFKPRIGEMIERELNEVKYSVRRSLCMEAGKQLDKHWGQVKYDDLSKISLPADKMNSLQAVFGSMYWADLDSHALFMEGSIDADTYSEYDSDKYNSIEALIMHEMVEQEKKLEDIDLLKMSEIYDIPFHILEQKRGVAEAMLYSKLHANKDILEGFN